MNNKILNPVGVAQMRVNDPFFSPRMDVIRSHMLPYQWDALNDRLPDTEPSHCIENFRIAAGLSDGAYQGMVFQDSDLYKWLEAVAFALAAKPDPVLRQRADEAIELMEKAQRPDGYLNTYYQLNGIERRWTNLQDNHELYCAGHMIEAAVAYTIATGTDRFLSIVRRYADLIDRQFGSEPEKMKGYPGHEVIEMALVKLHRLTGEPRYLKLAKYFVDQRGQAPLYFALEAKKDNDRLFYWRKSHMQFQYYQAGKPVREQKVAEGHAVRAVYLYSGMADVAMETGDRALMDACETLFDNIATRQMYITGAIGSTEVGEAFTFDYDLPNDLVYAETCAQLGLCFFAQRMLQNNPDSRYADVIERALYNGALSGMQLNGTRFFYVNPLEVDPVACDTKDLLRHVKYERQKWFPCSCCPPNLARALNSIASYAYSTGDDTLFVHLYLGGELDIELCGSPARFEIESGYPWQGELRITAKDAGGYALAVRVPSWCAKHAIQVNGQPVEAKLDKGYAYIRREWKPGDVVTMMMDMPVTTVRANPAVRADLGRLAVMRGPLVYCLEEVDNGKQLHRLAIACDAKFEERLEPQLLDGVVTLSCPGVRLLTPGFEQGALYAPASAALGTEPVALKWIPYYAWTNRTPGEMLVWVREI